VQGNRFRRGVAGQAKVAGMVLTDRNKGQSSDNFEEMKVLNTSRNEQTTSTFGIKHTEESKGELNWVTLRTAGEK
jgi:hypothetical protein